MTRALVLSGGGPVGIAWQTGLAAGLRQRGVDLAAADFIVGTSAGSAVGAQLALRWDMDERVERYRQAARRSPGSEGAKTAAAGSTTTPPPDLEGLMRVMAEAEASQGPDQERRATIGAFAREADTGPEEAFVDSFRYLAGHPWPEHYACTAVDAVTGEFVVWDAKAGVDLARAVASSCAVPGVFPPITVGDSLYMDGGMRSATNADLAKGHGRVLVVSLIARTQAQYGRRMDAEMAELRDAGATVELVTPDPEAAAAIGLGLMDRSRAFDAAEHGLRQGLAQAANLAPFWTGGSSASR